MANRKKAAVCVLLLEALDDHRKSRKGSKTRAWIRKRNTLGMFNFLQELGAEDTRGYKETGKMRVA